MVKDQFALHHQGPEDHPLRDLSIKWRNDGGVQLTSQNGQAIRIVGANLRNRRAAMVQIAPERNR